VAAEAVWLAILISSNAGLPGEEPLHYADEDADELQQALTQLGGLNAEQVFRVPAASPEGVTHALSAAVLRSSQLREQGHPTRLLVYYTGHAGADGLHLGEDVLSLPALKTAARVVPADERVFAIDACQSGALFRSKGARLVSVSGAPPGFRPPSDEAWITSSGAEEQSFEVDRRRGSLFTHFFVSGLRGAADGDGDHQITLVELFDFVGRQTTDAAARMGQSQTPQWQGALGGLVLSDLSRSEAVLEVVGPVSEPLLVVDRNTARVVAEVPVGAGSFVGVPAGRYQLLEVGDDGYRVAELSVARFEERRVDVSSALADASGVRSKGGLVVRRPLRVGAGVVGTAGAAPGQVPGLGLALRVDRVVGHGHDLGLVLTGWHGSWQSDVAVVRNRRVDVAGDWSYDLAWRGVRAGPGVRAGVGWLHQNGERRADGPWGPWFGPDGAATISDVAVPSLQALARVAVPLRDVELHATLGLGAELLMASETRLQPLAQGTLGLAWSFR